MTARDDAIEAACRAYQEVLGEDPEAPWDDDDWMLWRSNMTPVVDAVEPIIRADEREKAHTHNTGTSSPDACCECCYEVGGRNFRLRAQVAAAHDASHVGTDSEYELGRRQALRYVLRLLGGESDG